MGRVRTFWNQPRSSALNRGGESSDWILVSRGAAFFSYPKTANFKRRQVIKKNKILCKQNKKYHVR